MAVISLRDAIIRLKDGTTPTANSIEVKIGEGNLTYDETVNREYRLNRGALDEVRDGDEAPMSVSFDFEWQYLLGPPTLADTAVDNVAGYPAGTTTLTVDTMAVVPNPGRVITFSGHTTQYIIQSATATGIVLTNGLTDAVVDDEVISFVNTITVEDALKKRQGAAAWISSDTDICRPFALDIEIEYTPPCSVGDVETILLPDFRYESLSHDLSAGTISCSGQCNATVATSTRSAQA